MQTLAHDTFYASHNQERLERVLCMHLGITPEEVLRLTQGTFTRYPTPRFLQAIEAVLYCTGSMQECLIENPVPSLKYFGFVGPKYVWCKGDHKDGKALLASSEAAHNVLNDPSYCVCQPWTNAFALHPGNDYLDRPRMFNTFQESLTGVYGFNPWTAYAGVDNHTIPASDYTLERVLSQSGNNPNVSIYKKRLVRFLQDHTIQGSSYHRSGRSRDVYLDYELMFVYKVGQSQSLAEIKNWYRFMNPFMCPIEAVFMHDEIPVVCMPLLEEAPHKDFSDLLTMQTYINDTCRFMGDHIVYGLAFWDGFTIDVCNRSNWRMHQGRPFLVDYGETNNGLPIFSSWADKSLLYEPIIANNPHTFIGSAMGFPESDTG